MRLIDANILMDGEGVFSNSIRYFCDENGNMFWGVSIEDLVDIIDKQPTVYDIDKVVEQLEAVVTQSKQLCGKATREGNGIMARTWAVQQNAFEDAIEIVKKGGCEL